MIQNIDTMTLMISLVSAANEIRLPCEAISEDSVKFSFKPEGKETVEVTFALNGTDIENWAAIRLVQDWYMDVYWTQSVEMSLRRNFTMGGPRANEYVKGETFYYVGAGPDYYSPKGRGNKPSKTDPPVIYGFNGYGDTYTEAIIRAIIASSFASKKKDIPREITEYTTEAGLRLNCGAY